MRITLPCTEALPYLANYHSKLSPARFLQEELDVTFMERCCDIMDTGTEIPVGVHAFPAEAVDTTASTAFSCKLHPEAHVLQSVVAAHPELDLLNVAFPTSVVTTRIIMILLKIAVAVSVAASSEDDDDDDDDDDDNELVWATLMTLAMKISMSVALTMQSP